MADAASLVRHLEQKLAELDHRVDTFRSELAADFRLYSRERLSVFSDDVMQEVVRAVSRSAATLPNLGPAFGRPPSPEPCELLVSGPVRARNMRPTRGSPPPRASRDDNNGVGPEDSDHDSYTELPGLFTSSHVPLFGGIHGAEGHARSLSQVPSPAVKISSPPLRSDPASSPTSDASVSAGQARRSAMRTSSGSSRAQSPRHVRFDVEGCVVSTTTAPPIVNAREPGYLEPMSPPLLSLVSMIPVEMASSLLDDDDDSPPPKKVSSSQALRALSRVPLDDGTVWTVVNPIPEDEPSDQSSPLTALTPQESLAVGNLRSPPPMFPLASGMGTAMKKQTNVDSESENSSDNEFLALAPLRPPPGYPLETITGPIQWTSALDAKYRPRPKNKSTSRTAGKQAYKAGKTYEDDGEQGFFPFDPVQGVEEQCKTQGISLQGELSRSDGDDEDDDENGDNDHDAESEDEDEDDDEDDLTQKDNEKAKVEEKEDNDEEGDDNKSGCNKQNRDETSIQNQNSEKKKELSRQSGYKSTENQSKGLQKTPHATSSPRPVGGSRVQTMASGSFGSYKGRPILMPVVSKPEVMNTLPPQAPPDNSTKVAIDSTPRSLTERLYLEEAREAQKKAAKKNANK